MLIAQKIFTKLYLLSLAMYLCLGLSSVVLAADSDGLGPQKSGIAAPSDAASLQVLQPAGQNSVQSGSSSLQQSDSPAFSDQKLTVQANQNAINQYLKGETDGSHNSLTGDTAGGLDTITNAVLAAALLFVLYYIGHTALLKRQPS